MKTFAIGIWVLIVALGTSYAVASLGGNGSKTAEASKPVLQLEKARVLNVPIIADGAVRGFIVAQFGYTVEEAKVKALPVAPEAFLLDEGFRAIYTDDKLDFLHLDKYDINGLTHRLTEATNKRLGAEIIHEVLIQDFTFVSQEDSKR